MKDTNIFCGLKPAKTERNVPMYNAKDLVTTSVLNLITSQQFFHERAKRMSKDMVNATKLLDEATASYQASFDRFNDTAKKLDDRAKTSSQSVREAADKMRGGLERIQKQADFNNLEKYVNLLERAASALSILAEIENSGKLGKIADSLK